MGEVYRARDSRLGRQVALKVLPRELMNNREGLARFALEARSASALNHPNIVTLFEIGELDAAPYMAMELVEGWTLRHLIDAGPLPVKKTLDIAVQIASGLSKAHQAGIVHRDLKPENIMVTPDGFAKILDFGLAKLQDPKTSFTDVSPGLTSAGFVMGTPDYMSPEQAAARPLDFRSDQFALGLILYEMLTRRRAFHRATPVQTLSAIIQEEPEAIDKLNPKIPPPLRWVIERCIAKDRDERYATTRELARELKQIRDHLADFNDSGVRRTSHVDIRPDSMELGSRSMAAPSPASPTVSPMRVEAPTSRAPLAQKPRRPRRFAELAVVFVVGLVLFWGGAAAGHWFREKQADPPPTIWKGHLLVGPMTRVLAPRISPDGQTLAFVTLAAGRSQVAVMKPSSGDWSVLTHKAEGGSVYKVAWTRDGNKLLFDRVSDASAGVYGVPPIGGEERLVLEDAQSPEPLPDGSVLVVRRDAGRRFQLHRFFVDSGKVVPVGPPVVAESVTWGVRAFPDGKRALFWGRLADEKDPARRVYVLDLDSGRVTPFAPQLPLAPPLAISPDGSSVLAFGTFGDLQQAISVSADGEQGKVLFPVTGRAWSMEAASDGTLYVSTLDNPAELLRVAASGGSPDRLATVSGGLLASPVQLADGGLLLPSQVLGRRRLLIENAAGEIQPFLEASEQATFPAALVGDTRLAFLSGPVGQAPSITLATVPEGRVLRRLEGTSGITPQSLVASPDGRTLYYVDAGNLYSISAEGGTPRKLRAANGVAVDARMPVPSLVVSVNETSGVKLYRLPLSGASEEPVLFVGALRLAPIPLSAGAVGPDGRIAVTITPADSWFRGIGILDPITATLERVHVPFDGDVQSPAWGRDGSLLAMGVSMRASLWRFQGQGREKPSGATAAAP
jgi:serine/threonine protein kinase/Tol biopolymer transport system component